MPEQRNAARDAAKDAYQSAREIAKTLRVTGTCSLKVPDFATVTPCEGGHFVEAVIWVPEGQR